MQHPSEPGNFILYNDYHNDNRVSSTIAHELSHNILGHKLESLKGEDGARNFSAIDEEEAKQLGFTILIPKRAALHIVENFPDLESASEFYGASKSALEFRIRKTDARGHAMNRRRKYGRR